MTEQPAADPRAAERPRGEGTPPRYASFSDYVRVVRRHRWLVVLVAVGFTAASLAISLSKERTYQAVAQVSFRDVLNDANFLGGENATPEQSPQQLAQVNAELITGPQVTRIVHRHIRDDISASALAGSVTATVGTQTNLVSIKGEAADADLAATIANQYALAAKRVGDAAQIRRLRAAERALERQVSRAKNYDEIEAGTVTTRLSVLEQQLSRVRTLKKIAEPVQIVEHAQAPASPVSPTPGRDAVLGAMVGIVFGLLAAFGRDSLDRRLHTAKDVHEELGVPVLSRVPKTALGYSGLFANDSPPMPESEFEAFRVLRMNLGALATNGRPLRSVLVTSGLPEEGKSTVSIALASAAAVAGQRTLLVECDLRRPSFSRRLGTQRKPGLTDYLLGDASPQEVLQTVPLTHPGSTNGNAKAGAGAAGTLICVAAGSQVPNPAELLVGTRFRDFLAKVTATYDLVVLDGGPLLAIVDPLELVPQVDGVVLCVRAQRTTRDQVRATRAALANLPDRPVGAVLTGLRRGGPDSYDYYYGY